MRLLVLFDNVGSMIPDFFLFQMCNTFLACLRNLLFTLLILKQPNSNKYTPSIALHSSSPCSRIPLLCCRSTRVFYGRVFSCLPHGGAHAVRPYSCPCHAWFTRTLQISKHNISHSVVDRGQHFDLRNVCILITRDQWLFTSHCCRPIWVLNGRVFSCLPHGGTHRPSILAAHATHDLLGLYKVQNRISLTALCIGGNVLIHEVHVCSSRGIMAFPPSICRHVIGNFTTTWRPG